MSKYKEYQAQIAELQKKAEEARKEELASVIATVRNAIKEHNLSPADCGFKGAFKAAKEQHLSPPKYRDLKTGKTWTGRGKPPNWIAEAVKNKKADSFLISVQEEKAAEKAAKTAAKPVVAKAAAKPAAAKAAAKPAAAKPAAKKPAAKKPAAKKPEPVTPVEQTEQQAPVAQ